MNLIKHILLATLLALITLQTNSAYAFKVREITIEGNKRINLKTLKNSVNINTGDEVTPESLSDTLRKIYKTNFFTTAVLVYDTKVGAIHFKVQEAPIVQSVNFNGLKRFKKDLVLKELSIKSHDFYSKESLINDAKKMEMLYHQSGLSYSKVRPMVEFPKHNNENLKAIFDVFEGPQLKLGNIHFIGNESIPSKQLRKILTIARDGDMQKMSSTSFTEYMIDAAEKNVKDIYSSKGFARTEVFVATPIINNNRIDLSFFIKENKKYKFAESVITNDTKFFKFSTKEYKDVMIIKKGTVYNKFLVKSAERTIQNLLKDKGFYLAKVDHQTAINEKELTVKIAFTISDTRRVYVNKINISGNVATQNHVILREILIKPGDSYNPERIKNSIRRLYGLGYFKKVDIKEEMDPNNPDLINLTFIFEEQSTAQVNASIGYQVAGSILLSLSYSNSNLLGRGYGLSSAVEKSIYNTSARMSFSVPYALNRNISFSNSLGFSTTNNEDISNYKSLSTYLSSSIGYRITNNLTQSVSYGFRYDHLSLFDETSVNSFTKDQLGTFYTSKIGNTFFYDKRNNPRFPTSGYSVRLSSGLAGLGGNINFVSNEIGIQFFQRVLRDDSVIALSARVGYIAGYGGKAVNIKDRFFLGGAYGLRGFDFRSAGPVIAKLDDDGKIESYSTFSEGGKFLFLTSAEYYFPNLLPAKFGVKTYLFFDMGMVSSLDNENTILKSTTGDSGIIVDSKTMRASYGMGISWDSPFGNIGLSVGYPLISEEYDRKRVFMLNVGGYRF